MVLLDTPEEGTRDHPKIPHQPLLGKVELASDGFLKAPNVMVPCPMAMTRTMSFSEKFGAFSIRSHLRDLIS